MEETIQVKMSHLNKLLDQTGEVIITGTRLAILEKEVEEAYIKQWPVSKLILNIVKQITIASRQTANNLHKTVMDVRQVEFKDTMTTLQRLIRDLARTQEKKIKFKSSGSETLVDKAIIEELNGALIHLIRNAVDHGVETPDEREMKNKPAEGTITINVYKKDRFIYIDVEDDGAGIDVERVCAKAIERGLATQEKIEKMTESEKYDFIFLPGFSTREKVSEVSGRGVGMDVVKTSVERLKGSIKIESRLNEGTRFLFKIPIISAVNITDALMIEVDNVIYAIPISMVVATLSVNEKDFKSVANQTSIIFRGGTLQIYDLTSILNMNYSCADPETTKNIVVIREREEMIAIRVNKFLPPQKVVIKLLDDCFGKVRGISGTTLLSGDNVGLIIDVPELINLALGRESASAAASASDITPGAAAEASKTDASVIAAIEKHAIKKKTEKSMTKFKVEIDSDIDPMTKVEIALNYQGKLLDAFNSGKPVYEVDLMLETDIIKAQKTRFDIYQVAKSCGDLLCVVPITTAIPDNIKDFSPENFDMRIKFFILSNYSPDEIAAKLSTARSNVRTVGIVVKEEQETPSEKIFNEVELLEDYESFAIDSQKNISAMANSIIRLEENAADSDAIKEIFRAVHTLKSATAMLGIKNMSEVAHDIETILDRVRSGLDIITEEKVELLFNVLKYFEECMKSINIGIKPVLSNSEIKEQIVKFKDEGPSKKLVRVIDVKTEKFQITSYENLVISDK
ncbi:MAG TPA: ATP-binding protein, partial [Candidatus Wallbacteria bacterium]|nr:ATP-binding protein [Candidatus Wallbacteria bacterium]